MRTQRENNTIWSGFWDGFSAHGSRVRLARCLQKTEDRSVWEIRAAATMLPVSHNEGRRIRMAEVVDQSEGQRAGERRAPTVYHIPVCPFSQRLEILLTLKGPIASPTQR